MGGKKIPQVDYNRMSMRQKVEHRKPPSFLLPENRLDGKQRKPNHAEYDPSTLFISKADYTELTDGMKRYWEIKKNNMDKILFWRFGDWYVVHFDDLIKCGKYLDMAISPMPGCP